MAQDQSLVVLVLLVFFQLDPAAKVLPSSLPPFNLSLSSSLSLPLSPNNNNNNKIALCGNGVCEPSVGEDCVSCPLDCKVFPCGMGNRERRKEREKERDVKHCKN